MYMEYGCEQCEENNEGIPLLSTGKDNKKLANVRICGLQMASSPYS